jgi:hypothetical protein
MENLSIVEQANSRASAGSRSDGSISKIEFEPLLEREEMLRLVGCADRDAQSCGISGHGGVANGGHPKTGLAKTGGSGSGRLCFSHENRKDRTFGVPADGVNVFPKLLAKCFSIRGP